MQTVVMSFARGLHLGKPELPIDHAHVYFPVQLVHKVIAQCEVLRLKEGTVDLSERYKHNVDNAANNPYVIAVVFEGRCPYEQYPPFPKTPRLAKAYEEGILDASFEQIVSFASSYQTSFRIEVPLWHQLEKGIVDSTSAFFCTSGGAVCAGFAQVTLVDLRSSYQPGCEAKRKNHQKPKTTKTPQNKTEHKRKSNL